MFNSIIIWGRLNYFSNYAVIKKQTQGYQCRDCGIRDFNWLVNMQSQEKIKSTDYPKASVDSCNLRNLTGKPGKTLTLECPFVTSTLSLVRIGGIKWPWDQGGGKEMKGVDDPKVETRICWNTGRWTSDPIRTWCTLMQNTAPRSPFALTRVLRNVCFIIFAPHLKSCPNYFAHICTVEVCLSSLKMKRLSLPDK